jgi:two-component system heavy metal sensor histidine kinase CusS
MRDYSEICAWMLLVMIVMSGAIGLGLSRLALRPVRSIRETANHISSDNLSERIPVAAVRDEISELAELLNQMFARLESAFDQTRRFTAEASHELKTPLSLIRLQAEKLLMHGNLAPADEESLHIQLEEISRLSQIIEELLFLSRAEARDIDLHLGAHDPEVLLQNFGQDARVLSEHRGLRYVQTHRGAGIVQVEPRWVRRVLLNLLANALNASPRGGTVTLTSVVDAGVWTVSLADQGPGVAVELRERIFERFFRLAPEAGSEETGSGLGLAICRSIIALHGGRIWADASPGSTGLCVVFTMAAAA